MINFSLLKLNALNFSYSSNYAYQTSKLKCSTSIFDPVTYRLGSTVIGNLRDWIKNWS